MQTLLSPEARQQAAQEYTPLALEQRSHVGTNAAAHHIIRRPQTLRGWHCHVDYPIPEVRPLVINGRLAWPVAGLRRLLGVS